MVYYSLLDLLAPFFRYFTVSVELLKQFEHLVFTLDISDVFCNWIPQNRKE